MDDHNKQEQAKLQTAPEEETAILQPCSILTIQYILAGGCQIRMQVLPQPVYAGSLRQLGESMIPLWRCGPYQSKHGGELLFYFSDKNPNVVGGMSPFFSGDEVVLQEPWKTWENHCNPQDHLNYARGKDDDPDDYDLEEEEEHNEHCDQTYVAYEATPRSGYRPKPDQSAITYLHESSPIDQDPRLIDGWQPAATMPSWASRLTIGIDKVRVQRIQEITDQEIAKILAVHRKIRGESSMEAGEALRHSVLSREAYAALFDATKGPQGLNYADNPWVFVIDFTVLKRKFFGRYH